MKRKRNIENIYSERIGKIEELTKKIDYNDLNFIVNSTDSETNFSGVEDPITFLTNIKTNKITIEEAKASQEDSDKYLKMILRAKKLKSKRKHWQIFLCFLMEEMVLLN